MLRMSVNGGWMQTSTAATSSLPTRYDSFCTVWIASKWLLCIFQLAEMIGRRPSPWVCSSGSFRGIRCSSQCGQAGEVAELEELQRGAAAGRDVVDLVVQPELRERGG